MEVLFGLEQLENCRKLRDERVIVTVGKFETMHLGHLKVIEATVAKASELDGYAMVICVKQGAAGVFPSELLLRAMENLGVKWVLNCNIDELKNLEYQQFLSFLQKNFVLAGWVSSEKLSIGKNKKGTPSEVADYFLMNKSKNGESVAVLTLPSVEFENFKDNSSIHNISQQFSKKYLSSSYIRHLFVCGNVQLIAELCYFPVCAIGEVRHGAGVGLQLQFPTANIGYPKNLLAGLTGSFMAVIRYEKKLFPGMAFVGSTHLNDGNLQIESHLFNFSHSLYNRIIEIYLLKKIRDNMDLSEMENPLVFLRKQLFRDAKKTKDFFSENRDLIQRLREIVVTS